MNQKAVGEYLKRLRIRAKFTQTDLGSFIGVTDKAISRWESGVGMPEISNLLMLAKLYGVTVDDILNCNESVFALSPEVEVRDAVNVEEEGDASADPYAKTNEEQNNITEIPAERSFVSVQGFEAVKPKTLSAPSNKFRVILMFAYLIMGTFLAAEASSHGHIFATAFGVIFIALIFAVAVLGFISDSLPRKAYFIVNLVLYSVMEASILTLLPLLAVTSYGFGLAVACAVFALLFLIQLLYVIYDFLNGGKVKKILNYCALGTAGAAFVIALVAAIVKGTGIQSVSDFIAFSSVFVAIAALAFAFAQIFSKWINILTAISVVLCAIICICYRIFGFDMPLFDTDIDIGSWVFDMNFALGIAVCAVLAIIIGWFFEGYKLQLNATRITSAFAFAALIPLLVMTVDSFAVNIIFNCTERAVAVFVRIVVLTDMILYCIKAFRFDLIFKSLKKGVRNEEV